MAPKSAGSNYERVPHEPLDVMQGGPVDIAAVLSAASAQLGDSYAGGWIQNSAGVESLVILTREPAPPDFARTLAGVAAHRVVLRSGAQHSYANLRRLQAALSDRLVSIGVGSARGLGLKFDVKHNSVRLNVESTASAATVEDLQSEAARLGLAAALVIHNDSGHWEGRAL